MPDIDAREPWFLCYEHSDKDIDETLSVYAEIVRDAKRRVRVRPNSCRPRIASTRSDDGGIVAKAQAKLTAQQIVDLSKEYTFFSWSVQGEVDPIPVARAQGVYFWDANGKRYLDFASQLVNANIGHQNACCGRSNPAASRESDIRRARAYHGGACPLGAETSRNHPR